MSTSRGLHCCAHGLFVFRETLGYGTFGAVTKVSSIRDKNRVFALKTLDLDEYPDFRVLYMECYALQTLRHPHVVKYFGCSWDIANKKAYILTEYCPLSDLFYHIGQYDGRKFSLTCMDQIVDGLMYIHKMGFAHRDLKPENIFVDSGSRLKIGDFGYVYKAFSGDGRMRYSRQPCGSDAYMAPEVFHRDFHLPQLADMWSVGVIWLVVYLGIGLWEQPQASSPIYQLWLNPSDEQRCPWDEVDPRVLQTLKSLMNVHAERRPTASQLKKRVAFLKLEIFGPSEDDRSQANYECTQAVSQQTDYDSAGNERENPVSHWNRRTSFSQPARPADLSFTQQPSSQQPTTNNPKQMYRMTRFYVDTPLIRSACSYLNEVLMQSNFDYKQQSENEITIKTANVHIRVEIVQLTKDYGESEYCLVDIRRLHGDGLRFQKIFNYIRKTFEAKFEDMYIAPGFDTCFDSRKEGIDHFICAQPVSDPKVEAAIAADLRISFDAPLPEPGSRNSVMRGFVRSGLDKIVVLKNPPNPPPLQMVRRNRTSQLTEVNNLFRESELVQSNDDQATKSKESNTNKS